MRKLAILLAALTLTLASASAQVAVQQSPTHIDAATGVCTVSAALAVNQQETVTCTPPAGQFVYMTSIAFDVCTNGTGSAVNQVTWTTTNITGSPTFGFSVAATASICQHWSIPLPTPLKSTAAGTAVTFASPAGATNNSYHATVVAYYGN
jgi:hypothetical protein